MPDGYPRLIPNILPLQEKKSIKWIGLPTNTKSEHAHLEDLKVRPPSWHRYGALLWLLKVLCSAVPRRQVAQLERLKKKYARLQELVLQQIAFKNLIERNQATHKVHPDCLIFKRRFFSTARLSRSHLQMRSFCHLYWLIPPRVP